MKNLFTLFVLLFSVSSFAQVDKKSEDKENFDFTSKEVKFDAEQNVLELTGDVSFKTEIIEFENAEKVVFNKTTKEILVLGIKDFTIDGAITVAENPSKNVLRYKYQEKIAYIE